MTAHTEVTAASGSWTLAYTAAGAVTITLQNRSTANDVLVRIGPSTATSDAVNAAAEVLYARQSLAVTLANGDKVHVRSANEDASATPARVTVRA